jgi:hypothetical protein
MFLNKKYFKKQQLSHLLYTPQKYLWVMPIVLSLKGRLEV